MSDTITCARCGQTAARMAFKPFQNELGQQLYDTICGACWAEWTKRQQQLINHYALDPRTPEARQFLVGAVREFFGVV
jgi:Fe-S cluster biosynthesis and repair protein YggX